MPSAIYSIKAIIIFLSLMLCEIALDYLLRINSADFSYGGINELIWFGLHMVFAVVAAYFLFKGAELISNYLYKFLYFSVNIAFIFSLYVLILLFYITGAGIDSL